MKATPDELNAALVSAPQAELEAALGNPQPASSQQEQPGFMSLFRKANQAGTEFMARRRQELESGSPPSASDRIGLDWNTLEPQEKRAAIALAAMVIPTGISGLVAKAGVKGLMGAALHAMGWGAEGAAIGGGVQAVGNLATGAPLLQGVGQAAKVGAATNALLGAAGTQAPVASEEAKNLMRQGIVPTVGQAVDKSNVAGRALGRAEEVAGSFPAFGDIVTHARARGSQEWRQAVVSRANPPGAPALTGTTQERLAEAHGALASRYEEAARLADVPINSQNFSNWFTGIQQSLADPAKYISPEKQNAIMKYITDRIRTGIRTTPQGIDYLPGKVLSGLESDIGKWQRTEDRAALGSSPTAFESLNTAQALNEVKEGMRTMVAQESPAAGAIYQEINPLYAQYKTLEKASTVAPSQLGEFTPAQLLSTIRQRENPSIFAAGGRPGSLQESASQAQQVLGNRLPNSGTADRMLPWLVGGSLGTAGATIAGIPGAAYLAGIPLAALGSSRAGQRGLLGLMQGGQQVGPYAQRLATIMAPQLTGPDWSLLGR